MRPVLAQQAGCFAPVRFFDGYAHAGCDRGNVPEITLHLAIAVDVGLGHFPIIDAGVTRRARVAEHNPAIELVQIPWNGDTLDAGWPQFDGADTAIERRVVILRAGGHANDLRFDVLRNLADFLRGVAGAGEAV